MYKLYKIVRIFSELISPPSDLPSLRLYVLWRHSSTVFLSTQVHVNAGHATVSFWLFSHPFGCVRYPKLRLGAGFFRFYISVVHVNSWLASQFFCVWLLGCWLEKWRVLTQFKSECCVVFLCVLSKPQFESERGIELLSETIVFVRRCSGWEPRL